MDDYDYFLKYLIIGASCSGKTQIFERYTEGKFDNISHITHPFDFYGKNVIINDKIYRIQIWDTSGREELQSIIKGYYKRSTCILIVYDITQRETFNNLESFIKNCEEYAHKTTYIVLVGNKADLEESREVSFEEGKEFANKYGIEFYETSAKNGQNINEIFLNPAKEIDKRIFQGYYNFDDLECVIRQGLRKRKSGKIDIHQKNKNKNKISLEKKEQSLEKNDKTKLENNLQFNILLKYLNY